ncbi:hypothetical protein EYC84_001408 [Monilinia fructicola]|uniref:NADP-dependent oxidoreductase domain-containing protein n=1 Tax=Monilinia fructicola TaxID=38448 RepID=A0A5M9JXA8_MONFR|nr:hypothetical protein EYC84_001408 [Monilinia fructicola]
MGLSAFYGSTQSDEERFKVLDRAYQLGQTNWDSADIYADSKTSSDRGGYGAIEEGRKDQISGLSEVSASTIRRAEKVHHIDAVQVEYSPFALDIEQNDVLKTCRQLGIAIVAYSPLGRGFLTGQYKSRADFEPLISVWVFLVSLRRNFL